jgi:hypothetical protein
LSVAAAGLLADLVSYPQASPRSDLLRRLTKITNGTALDFDVLGAWFRSAGTGWLGRSSVYIYEASHVYTMS